MSLLLGTTLAILGLLTGIAITVWFTRTRQSAQSRLQAVSKATFFSSGAQLRGYVESELQGKVVSGRRDLMLHYRDARFLFHDPPPSHELWWVLDSARADPAKLLLWRHYLIEARAEDSEFLIWFGELTGFRGESPRDVMRPAVHIPFPGSADVPDSYTLGSVIRLMLEHEYEGETGCSPVVFPMNGARY